MMSRCYRTNTQNQQPTYVGCTVHPDFMVFDDFALWHTNQIGSDHIDWHMDKDIVEVGNKVYGPDTCVFVPRDINNFLTKRNRNRGEFLIGVIRYKSKAGYEGFTAQLNIGCRKIKKNFATELDAFNWYKMQKELAARQLALKYMGMVDPRVIKSLNNYTVYITD